MRIYDFRSDTVTLPTPAMMEAIGVAPLGDSARGDDPTVARLEEIGRELTGKADALFVPSGTMANLAAVIAHDCRGGEVIVELKAPNKPGVLRTGNDFTYVLMPVNLQ